MKTRGRRTPSAFTLVVVGILLLGAAAIAVSRQTGPADDSTATASVRVSGQPLPGPDATGATDPAIGVQAPEVTGVDFDGQPVRITNDGRPKAVLFLAHWCPHCQQGVRDLNAWLSENRFPEGADLYSVSTLVDRTRGNYPPGAWLEREGWTIPTLVDDAESSTADVFGLRGTPYWVFIDREGNVALRSGGEMNPEMLNAVLTELART